MFCGFERMSQLTISTITICGRLTASIPIKEIAASCAQFIQNSKKRAFLNQVTILVPVKNTERKINCKVFRNGKIQTSGAKSILEFQSVCEVFQRHASCDVVDMRVVMMNSSFVLPGKLDLFIVSRYMFQLGLKTSFDLLRHPPCNVRYFVNPNNPQENGICDCLSRCTISKDEKITKNTKCTCRTVTCLIFASGKIVLTGAEKETDLELVRLFLIKHLTPMLK